MDDPDSKQIELWQEQCGDVKPIDISGSLPRHATKKYSLRKESDIVRIVVHTTDWDTTVERIAQYDIGKNHISDTGCPAYTYHETIMNDGVLYKTLPAEEVSWQVGMWNKGSYGIALMYRAANLPTMRMMKTLQCRCGQLCLKYGLTPDKVVGHRELKGTGWFWSKGSKKLRKTCPGMNVDLDKLRIGVAKYMQIMLKMKGFYTGRVDGVFGKGSKAALEKYNVS